MPNQVIDGTLDLEVPAANTPIQALTIDVQSFDTIANAIASHFIAVRDVGAAPPNGLTEFIVRGDGNVGVGTANPSARLDVRGTTVIDAPASATPFNVLTVNTESFSTVANLLSSFFITASDIGAAPPGGQVKFSVRGDGQVLAGGGIRFPDGSVQGTASPPSHVILADAPGIGGAIAVQRAAGDVPILVLSQNTGGGGVIILSSSSGQPRLILSENTGNAGFLAVLGSAGRQAVQISTVVNEPDTGSVAVTDAAGAAAGLFKAQLSVDASGRGLLTADVKNFRVPNPLEADTDIVYACVEGPEAAAYIRGTADLVKGSCTVELPDHFVSVIAETGMTVQITPLSVESRGVAVVEKSTKSFVVRELHKGAGNYPFDWEVNAIRKGFEDYRVIRPSSERNLAKHRPPVSVDPQ